MPPARAALYLASLAGVLATARTLLVAPPPLPLALAAFAAYLAFVLVAVLVPGWSVFGDVVTEGPEDARGVALTFEGGPDPTTTPALLDALDAAGIHATFFLDGASVDAHPEVARGIVERGHHVGLHVHAPARLLAFRGTARARADLAAGLAAIERACGVRPKCAAPPNGRLGPSSAAAAAGLGLVLVGWTVAAPRSRHAARLEAAVARGLTDGAVVRLHAAPPSVGQATIAALPGIAAAAARLQLPVVRLDAWLAPEPRAGAEGGEVRASAERDEGEGANSESDAEPLRERSATSP